MKRTDRGYRCNSEGEERSDGTTPVAKSGGCRAAGAETSQSRLTPRPNTDNLGWTEDPDGAADGQGGGGPGAVGGAFEVVVAHLAAYDAGVGA